MSVGTKEQKVHFSPVTKKWEACNATIRDCPLKGAEHKTIPSKSIEAFDLDGDGIISKEDQNAIIDQIMHNTLSSETVPTATGPSLDDLFGSLRTTAKSIIDEHDWKAIVGAATAPQMPDTPSPDSIEADTTDKTQEVQALLDAINRPLNLATNFPQNPIQPIVPAQPASGNPQAEATQKKPDDYSTTIVPPKEETFEDVMEDVDALVGLDEIKTYLKTLVNVLKVQKMRKDKGLPVDQIGLHIVMEGNPGSGKTTVARLLGRLYKAAGRLSVGQVVEVSRADLVGGFVGQTAIKTTEKLNEAKGGVFFLDEGYSLVPDGSSGNDFGPEALTTILKFMEDNRNDFCFVTAGYPKEMEKFLDSNPGFRSRFNDVINFPDYSATDMTKILDNSIKKGKFKADQTVEDKIQSDMNWLTGNKDANFANARLVRKYFEKMVQNQANRLANVKGKLSVKTLSQFTIADLPTNLKELQ